MRFVKELQSLRRNTGDFGDVMEVVDDVLVLVLVRVDVRRRSEGPAP